MNEKEKIFVTKAAMPEYEEFIEAIKPLWDTHRITNMGEYHHKLEEKIMHYLNVPYASLMVNGHMALEMTIQAFDFPKGSEIITTPFTFISTTHAIIRNGMVPVFCDVKEDGTIDENKIEDLITEKTVAILPVHVYGNVCNIDAISDIAYKYNLKVIYDAAHAFGISVGNKNIANCGDASCFSFHATKIFNTIEGGAVTFSDEGLYEKLYNLKNFGIRGEEVVVAVGANAKMNEFSAIMGLCNLNHLEENIEKRKVIYEYYERKMASVVGVRLLKPLCDQSKNYAYLPAIIEDECAKSRNEIYSALRENDIYARKYFYPLTSDQACFKNKYKDISLQMARYLSERILCLPIYPDMDVAIVDRIINIITE